MRKEVLQVWFDEYPNDGHLPKPLQNLPIPSIEFLIIKVRFFKTGVRRPPLAPMTIHPIELYSSIVPVQQLAYLQEVRDFFSPIRTPIGAEAEDLKRITSLYKAHKERFFNSKELPITVTICAVSQQDEIDEQVRVAATEIGERIGRTTTMCNLPSGAAPWVQSHPLVLRPSLLYKNCFLKWLQRKQSKPNCPLCRHEVPVVSAVTLQRNRFDLF